MQTEPTICLLARKESTMLKIDTLKIPADVALEEYQIYVRPYLTQDDIISIGEMMLACDNYITRECVLMLEVFDRCTDIEKDYIKIPEEETEDEKFIGFDLMILSGLRDAVYEQIVNIDEVYNYIDSALNVGEASAIFIRDALTPALERIVTLIEKYEKKLPKSKEWKAILEELPNTLKIVSQNGNAEIIRGAIKMNTVGGDSE